MPAVFLAPSLARLRAEVDRAWPQRSKTSDGWLGDAAHRARRSEHNPDATGCVRALDLDRDGIDPLAVVRAARAHPATWYVIFDRVIWSRTHAWAPRRYTGPNPHTGHLHVSIRPGWQAASSLSPWLDDPGRPPARPPRRSRREAPGKRVLREGSTGRDVAALQRVLAVTPDGVFGPVTKAALQRFQLRHDLHADGVAGWATWAKIRGVPR